jgi:hypothetical protein
MEFVNGIVHAKDIAQHVHELSWRDTSHHRDETLVVSLSLGLAYDQIVKEEQAFAIREPVLGKHLITWREWDHEDEDRERQICLSRMRRFLVSAELIPESMIFMTGPKLPFPNFRWAPRTFMQTGYGSKLRIDPATQELGQCTADGLLGQYRMFKFTSPWRITSSDLNNRAIMLVIPIGASDHCQIGLAPSTDCFTTSDRPAMWTHLIVPRDWSNLELGDTGYGAIVTVDESHHDIMAAGQVQRKPANYVGPVVLEGFNGGITYPLNGFLDMYAQDEGLQDLCLR